MLIRIHTTSVVCILALSPDAKAACDIFVDTSDVVTASAASVTVDPATITGLAEGDEMRFIVVENDNITITSDEGLENIVNLDVSTGGDSQVSVWRKAAAASETGTYTFTTAGGLSHVWRAVIVAYSGVDADTPDDATATTVERVDDSTPLPSTITTVTDGACVVVVLGGGQGGTPTIVQPSGYALRAAADFATYMGVADLTKATAGLESPGDWSGIDAGADSGLVTMALRPAETAGALRRRRSTP